MKLIAPLFLAAVFFISCSNDEKSSQVYGQVSSLKSDILIQSAVSKPFSRPDANEELSLTLSGASLLEATATFKVINEKGAEIHCETFPSKKLIQSDYRTANSSLQEAHIRDVVEGYFIDDQAKLKKQQQFYAGL